MRWILLLLLATACRAEIDEDDPNLDIEAFLRPQIHEGLQDVQLDFQMESDHERLCGVEGRLMKENSTKLVLCSADADCLPPSVCHSTGYCCLVPLMQESAPVGCPMGTRALVSTSGKELSCNPNVPDSCPGGAMCYEDGLTGEKRCCGKDPGQGCPSGSRALLNGTSTRPLLCRPGSIDESCPGGAVCQWSHLIDRYQCCEPDNGCPRHQTPSKVAGKPLNCRPGSVPCPRSGACRFNFWTASYQCCETDLTDLCPIGHVPFLDAQSGVPKQCEANADCPAGYSCGQSKTCCGIPGTCPDPHRPTKDSYGRLTACTSSSASACPADSQCLVTKEGGQMLCCTATAYTCPGVARPVPSALQPRVCSLADPTSCPGNNECMPSNVPSLSICCSTGAPVVVKPTNTCPAGWSLANGEITYCVPNMRANANACPGASSCLRSTTVQQQFVCCIPGTMHDEPANACANPGSTVEVVNGVQKHCTFFNAQCGQGFSCQPGLLPSSLLCCSAQAQSASFTCPMPGQSPALSTSGNNLYCNSLGLRDSCPIGAICSSAGNSPQLSICCYSQPQMQQGGECPSGMVSSKDANGNSIFCSPSISGACPGGSQCLASPGQLNTYTCCRENSVPRVCPNNQNALLTTTGAIQTCSGPGDGCSGAGYSCQLSTALASWICCGGTASVGLQCADGSNAYRPVMGGAPLSCSPLSFPSICPSGYSCSPSTEAGTSLCCQSGAVTPSPNQAMSCPMGWNSFRSEFDDQPRTCSGSLDRSCPLGYSCTPSTLAGQFMCCRLAASLRCLAGTTYLLNSQPRLCSRDRLNQCPAGFACAQSTAPTVSICCGSAQQDETMMCPDRSAPAMVGQNYRFCPLVGSPSGCPTGHTCQQSNKGTNVCCVSGVTFRIVSRNPSDELSQVCGPTAVSYKSNGGPMDCTDRPGVCPGSHPCRPSFTNTRMYCCAEAQCPNGVLAGQHTRPCRGHSDCPAGGLCTTAKNVNGLSICCSSDVPVETRCEGRATQLTGGVPVGCLVGSSCSSGFECSAFTSNGRSVCCEKESTLQNTCPDNRVSYRMPTSDEVMLCENNGACPSGYACMKSTGGRTQGRAVCCSANVAQCPLGQTALFDASRAAKRCYSMDAINGCSGGFGCVPSTVGGVRVCCRGGTIGGGASPQAAPTKAPIGGGISTGQIGQGAILRPLNDQPKSDLPKVESEADGDTVWAVVEG